MRGEVALSVYRLYIYKLQVSGWNYQRQDVLVFDMMHGLEKLVQS